MKRTAFFMNGILVIAIFGLVFTNAQVQKKVEPKLKTADIVAPLPAFLDNYFPPKAEGPVFLFRMMGMSNPLAGILVDLFENDLDNARANFEKFRVQYVEISKLVPEWEKNFPMAPVNDLGQSLKIGEPGKVTAAFEVVSQVCSDCHLANQPRVYYKYHYSDFHDIKIMDPLTHQEVSFQQLMLFLETSYTGIGVDVEQGQKENALQQFQGFQARFQAMEETCMNCHDTERYYYVGQSVKSMIDKLGQSLNAPAVDPKQVNMLTQGIGMESCFKCHLVHIPAAAAQIQIAKQKNLGTEM